MLHVWLPLFASSCLWTHLLLVLSTLLHVLPLLDGLPAFVTRFAFFSDLLLHLADSVQLFFFSCRFLLPLSASVTRFVYSVTRFAIPGRYGRLYFTIYFL